MNGPEHYREAEALLARAKRPTDDDPMSIQDQANHFRAAQVHAVLALAAATAGTRTVVVHPPEAGNTEEITYPVRGWEAVTE